MDTTLVYTTALLLAATIAAGSNAAETLTSTTTTATPLLTLTSTEATLAPKLKRGVVEIGTNIWAHNGGFQSRPSTPGTSAVTVNQNAGPYSPQRISQSPSAYSPVQNNGRSLVQNNQNSGHRHVSAPYSSPSHANVAGSYGNAGQTDGTNEQSFGNNGRSHVSSPQHYGIAIGGLNSGVGSVYTPQSQSTGSQISSSFGNYRGAQSPTNSAQSGQNGQIQNGGISTPYYTSFASAPSPLKYYVDKAPAGQYGASLVQAPQQQRVQKTETMYAPNHQSASYTISNLGSYSYPQASSLSPGSPVASQGNPVFSATSQIPRNALKNNFEGVKSPDFSQIYAPLHQSASTFVPNVQSNGFSPATVDFNGKNIPLPVLQLQSAQDFPDFPQTLTSQPLVFDSSNPFQAQPDFTFLNDFTKSLNPQSGSLLQFYNPQQADQPQVLPVKSANGTPQFPQYKGARINTSPDFNLARPAVAYEPLNTQPQLHFTGKLATPQAAPSPISTSTIVHHPPLSSRPKAEIRDDVEVINKKKRPTPPPHDSDEDDEDEGYKAIEREYGQQQHDEAEDDEPHRGKNFKESNIEGDFKPSRSFPFKSYDEQFHKYSKPSSSDDDSDDEKPSSRYRYSQSADDDDDHEGYSSTRHSDYKSPKARPSRYEDDGEESQKYERQEESEEDDDRPRKPAAYNSYGKDFEEEFEDSYKRPLPKTKYVHIKEVPEIDDPASPSSKSYSNSDSPSKSSKYKGRKNYEPSHDEDSEESKTYSRHTSPHKYEKVSKSKDNEGHGSNIRSYNKGYSPKVIHEDSFGYKTPAATGHSKYKKSPSGESYSSVKKSPNGDSYVQSSRSSYKSPKNDKSHDNGDSYSYSHGSSWKSDKKSAEPSDFHGHSTTAVKTLALPEHKTTFHGSIVGRGSSFLSKNINTMRDLTGI